MKIELIAYDWWDNLPFEAKFYAVIKWLKDKGEDTTSLHPDEVTNDQIKNIYLCHLKFKAK